MITNQNAHDDITEQFRYFKANKSARFTRLLFSDDLIEHYFEQNEQIPPTTVLDRLGTLILQDEYSDRDPQKMRRAEKPFQSAYQQHRLRRKELKAEHIEYANYQVVGRKKSVYEGDDGSMTPVNSPVFRII